MYQYEKPCADAQYMIYLYDMYYTGHNEC